MWINNMKSLNKVSVRLKCLKKNIYIVSCVIDGYRTMPCVC